MVSNIIFNLNYQIMEKEPVQELTLFLCNGTKKQNKKKKHRESHRGRGYHLKIFFFFLTHISFLINDKIMEKESVRAFTSFQCDGTKKHWEPQREREYHLQSLFPLFSFLSPLFFFFFVTK